MSKHVLISLAFLSLTSIAYSVPPTEEGKIIYVNRCAACHSIHKDLTGPALAGIDQRRSLDWIIKFVHSPRAIINSGDTIAAALLNKYNKIVMPDHPDLTDNNIKNVIEYIKSEAKQVSADKPPFTKLTKRRPAYVPLSITKNASFFIAFMVLVGLVIGIMVFAVEVKSIERKRLSVGYKD